MQFNLSIKYKMRKKQPITLLIFLSMSVHSHTLLDIETGIVATGYNDVRIPGNQGTLFSLKDDLKTEAKIYYRLRVSYVIKSRHTLSLLYAPLELKSEGTVPYDISFAREIFPANTKLNGTYKFNSYRLTYRYDIVKSPKIDFGLGFTAKIRDARIAISSGGLTAEKTNVGFVPILNFRLIWRYNEKTGFLLDGDALAAPQGRAEDVTIAAAYQISSHLGIRAGYRILEGGADNDKVYSFALFHYASIGFTISF
jgi:hypothetical protein